VTAAAGGEEVLERKAPPPALDAEDEADSEERGKRERARRGLVPFGPQFAEVAESYERDAPNLGVLVRLANRTIAKAKLRVQDLAICHFALERINTLTLSELLSISTPRLRLELPENANDSHKKSIAYQQLVTQLEALRTDARLCFFILETSLQLLHHHAVVYLGSSGKLLGLNERDVPRMRNDFISAIKPLLDSLQGLLALANTPYTPSRRAAPGSAQKTRELESDFAPETTALTLLDVEAPGAGPVVLFEGSRPTKHKGATHVFLRTLIRKLKALLV